MVPTSIRNSPLPVSTLFDSLPDIEYTDASPEAYFVYNSFFTVKTQNEIPQKFSSQFYYPTQEEPIETGGTLLDIADVLSTTGFANNPYDVVRLALSKGDVFWEANKDHLFTEIAYDYVSFTSLNIAFSSVFVTAVLKRSNCKYVKTANALKYQTYGEEVLNIKDIRLGDIVVFSRKTSGAGYVGFFAGDFSTNYIGIIGMDLDGKLRYKKLQRYKTNISDFGIVSIRRPVHSWDGKSTPLAANEKPYLGHN